jgi:succinate dehydrogenase / fumarate reductase, cytochrome b subunit
VIAVMRANPLWGRAAWVLHRASGVGVLLFLLIHVGDTALIRLGPHVYDTVIAVYRQGAFRALEIVLMAAVLFHALNGLRVTIQDLWPGWISVQRPMVYGTYLLTAALWLPSAYFMAIR